MIFPVKRQGSEDNAMVTVGRARNMNIVLDSPSVSKLHAYFKKDAESGAWTITDVGSTNGTALNGQRLVKNEPAALRDGDIVELAEIFTVTFCSARSAYWKLRHM